jgi:RNA polymerase sigma-70 factor, ECF subfamily
LRMDNGPHGFSENGKSSVADARAAALRHFDLGRMAWPQLALGLDAFTAYFERHALSGVLPRDGHAADMYLACSCACAIEGGLAAFERDLGGDMARAVASIDASTAFVEDVQQIIRERLFVARGGEPGKIATYGGRSSLKSWLAAVAVRSAISRRRRKGDQRPIHFVGTDDLCLAGGPEFEYLRGRYKSVFEGAVRSAVERLPAKERMLLRLNLVNGMSIDRLGAAYRVGRSTAARWLADARLALIAEARCALRTELQVSSAELDSLAAEMRSQLEVSILSLLAPRNGESVSAEV